ncbi:hypothetical protein D3C84_1111320 [compost metagenome]
MQNRMEELADQILALQRDFDYGDEVLLREYGGTSNGCLQVGEQQYDTVIISDVLTLESATFTLLKQLVEAGGKVVLVGEAPRYLEGVLS